MDEATERDVLADRIFELARTLQQRAGQLGGPAEPPPDLTVRQLRVLGLVSRSPGLTGMQLGHSLGVSAPTASGLVDRLAHKGLIRRVEDPADRRIRRLHLSQRGEAVMVELESQTRRLIGYLVPLLTTSELRTLIAGYDVMLAAVERANPAAAGGSS